MSSLFAFYKIVANQDDRFVPETETACGQNFDHKERQALAKDLLVDAATILSGLGAQQQKIAWMIEEILDYLPDSRQHAESITAFEKRLQIINN